MNNLNKWLQKCVIEKIGIVNLSIFHYNKVSENKIESHEICRLIMRDELKGSWWRWWWWWWFVNALFHMYKFVLFLSRSLPLSLSHPSINGFFVSFQFFVEHQSSVLISPNVLICKMNLYVFIYRTYIVCAFIKISLVEC